MDNNTQKPQTYLKNSDFLAWRVNNFQRLQKEETVRKIFASRDHVRPTWHN